MSLDDSFPSIASSGVIMLTGSVLGRALALGTEALIARSLGPTVFGRIGLAYTVILTAASVLLVGVNQAIPRLLPAADTERQQASFVQSAYLFALLLGIVGIIVLFVLVRGPLRGEFELIKYLLLFSPFLVVYPISRISFAVLRSWEQTVPAIVSRSVVSRVLGLGLWVLIFYLGFSVEAAVGYWLAVPSVTVVFAGYYIRRRLPLRHLVTMRPEKSAMRRMLSFSWPLAMSSLVFTFLSRMDILMIGYFLVSREVGYYRAIQPFRQVTVLVLGSFGFLFLPLATRCFETGNLPELDRLFTSVTKWIVVITLPVILGFVFFAESIVVFAFGADYLPAALPLSVLLGGLFVRTVTGLDGDVVKAIDRPKIEFYSALTGLGSNLVLNILLIPQYGIVGAAVATVVGYAVYNAVELAAIYRIVGITPFSWDILKPVAFTTVSAAALVHVIDVPSGIIFALGATALFGVLSVLSVPFTGSIGAADRILVERLEQRTGREFAVIRRLFDIE